MQLTSFLVLLAALAELSLALVAALRRYFFQQDIYALSIEDFDERLMSNRAQRIDRGREASSWSGFRKFRIARKVDEGGGICSFYLEAHDHKPIPSYRAGQYLTFSLKIPEESRPVVRCYSLSDAPDPTRFRVSIKRIPPPRNEPDAPPGRGSGYFHDQLGEDSLVDVKSPAGDFFLDLSKNRPVVLIGGGVGITPVLAMLNTLAARDMDRDVYFFYGVRDQSEHVMKEHLDALARQYPQELNLHVCYSGVPAEELPKDPNVHYHSEFVSVELFKRVLPSSNFEYYICGPPPMMDSVTHDLREWGVPDSDVFFESFGAASVKKTPKAEEIAAAAGESLMITFARSGKEIHWNPAAGSLLDFAEENDVVIDSGCRAGSCGSCVTAIKEGDIEYLTDPGEPPDAGTCLTCISVPKSNLVIDA